DGVLRLDFATGGARWFFVAGGFAQMKNDNLTILTQEAVAAEDVVRKDAEADLEKARAIPPKTEEDFDRRQRAIKRAESLLGLLNDRRARAYRGARPARPAVSASLPGTLEDTAACVGRATRSSSPASRSTSPIISSLACRAARFFYNRFR